MNTFLIWRLKKLDDCAHITAVSLLRRSDKRKDRVEISPEQLAMGAQEAEVCLFCTCTCLAACGLSLSTSTVYEHSNLEAISAII